MKRRNVAFFVIGDPDRLCQALKRVSRFTKILGDQEGPIPIYEQEAEFLRKHVNQDKVFEISTVNISGRTGSLRKDL